MKPQTYMNRSGESVAAACKQLDIPIERVIVAYDEADLPLGRLRVRRGGGPGGHRGVSSIIDRTGSREFCRVRLGIGRPPDTEADLAEHVLSAIPSDAKDLLVGLVARAADAVECVLEQGVEVAMREFNGLP